MAQVNFGGVGGGWEGGSGGGGGSNPTENPPPPKITPQVAVAAGCAQLRVEVSGGPSWDLPSMGATDLGATEGWVGVTFEGAALRELARPPPTP